MLDESFASFDGLEERYNLSKPFEFDLMNGDLSTIYKKSVIEHAEVLVEDEMISFLECINDKYIAIVEGKKPIAVSISIIDNKYIRLRCSCESDKACYHTAAVILAIRKKLKLNSFYKVKLIKNDEDETLMSCDCPYEDNCKHEYATLLAIQNGDYIEEELKPFVAENRMTEEELIKKIPSEALKKYLLSDSGLANTRFNLDDLEKTLIDKDAIMFTGPSNKMKQKEVKKEEVKEEIEKEVKEELPEKEEVEDIKEAIDIFSVLDDDDDMNELDKLLNSYNFDDDSINVEDELNKDYDKYEKELNLEDNLENSDLFNLIDEMYEKKDGEQ